MATNLDQRATLDMAFENAVRAAEHRAYHSFFNQHVIEDEESGYLAIDEGDYDALPAWLVDRVAHTVPGMMADEF